MTAAELPPAPSVAGTSLAGAAPYVITAEENRTLCASLGSVAAADGTAHPIYFFIATQVGMGRSVAGLCALCDFDVEEDVTRLVRAIMSLGVDLVRWYRLEGTDKPDELADSYAGLVQRMLGVRVGD